MNISHSKKIHAVYFSCQKHFKYLFLSLKSLQQLQCPYVQNIYVYIDKADPLTAKQKKDLLKVLPNIYIRDTQNITGYGKEYILSEMSAFQEITKEIQSNDYIMKTDSDILFLNDSIFESVIVSESALVGHNDRGESDFPYVQGGCYFMLASFVPHITDLNNQILEEVAQKVDPKEKCRGFLYPEDAVMHSLIQKKTDKILFFSFMDEHYLTYKNTSLNQSLIHFRGTKKNMWVYFYLGKRLYSLLYFLSRKLFIFGRRIMYFIKK